MPGDEFRKKLSGQVWRPGSHALNSMMDAAADAKAARAPSFHSPAVDQFYQSGIVKVLNTTGQPIPRFGVLGITGPIITPAANLDEFQRQVALNGTTPAAAQAGNFAVMMDAVPAGWIGRGVVSGVTPCQVKVGSGGFADLLAGDVTQLQQQGGGGAQILWQDPAVSVGGTAWAVVRIGASGKGGLIGCSLLGDTASYASTPIVWTPSNNTAPPGLYDTSGFVAAATPAVITIPTDGLYTVHVAAFLGDTTISSGQPFIGYLTLGLDSYSLAACPLYAPSGFSASGLVVGEKTRWFTKGSTFSVGYSIAPVSANPQIVAPTGAALTISKIG